MRYCVAYVAPMSLFLFMSHYAHIYIHTHTDVDLNFKLNGEIAKLNTQEIESILVHKI